MKTEYRDFCEKYNEKLINDNSIKENKMSILVDDRVRITFYLSLKTLSLKDMPVSYRTLQTLFELDKEDLEYLYNKYSIKAKEEMKHNIEEMKHNIDEIKNSYNKL